MFFEKMCLFIVLFLLAVPNVSNSETIGDVKIISIKSYSDYSVVIFEPSRINNQNCSSVNNRENHVFLDYRVSANDLNIHATLLSAYSMKKNVEFELSGCTSNLGGGIPKAVTVRVYD